MGHRRSYFTYPAIGTASESTFDLHFRTGTAPASRTKRARVLGHAELSPSDARILACAKLLESQGCFDTIEPLPSRLYTFELGGGPSIAWLVHTERPEESMLWPATCGVAALVQRASDGHECFTIQPITPAVGCDLSCAIA